MSSAPSVPDASDPAGSPTGHAGCEHARTTNKGTNKFFYFKKCLDCGAVLRRERKESTTPPVATRAGSSATTAQEACPHQNVSWADSNGHRWRRTCRDCGVIATGPVLPRTPASVRSATSTGPASAAAHDGPDVPVPMRVLDHICQLGALSLSLFSY